LINKENYGTKKVEGKTFPRQGGKRC
jgi:hypothetical protein